jgi:hypothetical protein
MLFFDIYHNVKLIYDIKSQSLQISNNGKVFVTKPLHKSTGKLQQSGLASASLDPVSGWYGVEVKEGEK